MLADDLQLAILLQDLARDVQRKIVGVDHAFNEAQVGRHEIAALVHDEDALHIKLQAALHLGAVEVEGRLGGEVEQRVRLQRTFYLYRDRP